MNDQAKQSEQLNNAISEAGNEYDSLQYPGDLAADVLGDSNTKKKPSVLWRFTRRGLIAAAVILLVLIVLPNRPQRPQLPGMASMPSVSQAGTPTMSIPMSLPTGLPSMPSIGELQRLNDLSLTSLTLPSFGSLPEFRQRNND